MLRERHVTYVTIGSGDDRLEHYDAALDLEADGAWRWSPVDRAASPETMLATGGPSS